MSGGKENTFKKIFPLRRFSFTLDCSSGKFVETMKIIVLLNLLLAAVALSEDRLIIGFGKRQVDDRLLFTTMSKSNVLIEARTIRLTFNYDLGERLDIIVVHNCTRGVCRLPMEHDDVFTWKSTSNFCCLWRSQWPSRIPNRLKSLRLSILTRPNLPIKALNNIKSQL